MQVITTLRAAVLRMRIAAHLRRVERSDVTQPLVASQARVWLRQAGEMQQRLTSIEGRAR